MQAVTGVWEQEAEQVPGLEQESEVQGSESSHWALEEQAGVWQVPEQQSWPEGQSGSVEHPVQVWDSGGLPWVVPQELRSVQVLVWVPWEQDDQSVHCQLGVQGGGEEPSYSWAPMSGLVPE